MSKFAAAPAFALGLTLVLSTQGCGGEASVPGPTVTAEEGRQAADVPQPPVAAPAREPLRLGGGEQYRIRSSGAIDGEWFRKNDGQVYFPQVSTRFLTLRMTGSNRADAAEVSDIFLIFDKDIEPGSYPIQRVEGTFGASPSDDTPLVLTRLTLRYPAYHSLKKTDQVDGTITFTEVGDRLAGTLHLEAEGKGGPVKIDAVFAVPLQEPRV